MGLQICMNCFVKRKSLAWRLFARLTELPFYFYRSRTGRLRIGIVKRWGKGGKGTHEEEGTDLVDFGDGGGFDRRFPGHGMHEL